MLFSSYAAVLRAPHACRTFGAVLLGRLSYGMISLSLMLAVKNATGSYRAAGGVMALFALTSVFLSPFRAGLVDRYGPRRALVPMACAYALLLAGLACATWRPGAPGLLVGLLAVSAGACTPPLGPAMRSVWRVLLPERQALHSAYSLDAVAEELLLVTGPLLVGLLVKFTVPAAGVALSAALVLTGTLAFVSSPVLPGLAASLPDHSPDNAADDSSGSVPAAVSSSRARRGRDTGLWGVVMVCAGIGIGLGAVDLLIVAFTERWHRSGAVFWVLASLSAGSALGGLAYGAVRWRLSGRQRLLLIVMGMALTLATAGLSPNVYVLMMLAGLAGVFVAPALTTAYLVADECARPDARTRAGAWVNTAFNAGSAGGTATAGLLVGHLPLEVCFGVVAFPALLCAAMTMNRPRLPEGAMARRKDRAAAVE
ncbi:MFS transporter [Streptomyces sp. NPDC048483]|uniref:MFS transporter n=1 Tax=Streptomyces sp. NPDC048483 TaxID=3154927 RepID=UPI003429123E